MENKNNKKVFVGLVGFGTVGQAVLKLFYKNKNIILQKAGCEIVFKSVCEKFENKKEILHKIDKNIIFTSNVNDIIYDKDIDIVVELIGGDTVAKEIIVSSLKNGKHIVTANKAVLSQFWSEIFGLGNELNRMVYFESSVGAGIPVVQALNEGLAANKILRICGILNGTTNYILSTMKSLNQPFKTALKTAQKYGFAERNPEMDIKGIDSMHKLSILSSIAYSRWVRPQDIYVEGIEDVELEDIHFAESFGYEIKLLGNMEILKNKFLLEVRKFLVSKKHIFSSIINEYNAILIEGDFSGPVIFSGKGAGGNSAASAVMSDIIYAAKGIVNIVEGKFPYVVYDKTKKVVTVKHDEIPGFYYVRFTTVDRPGVLAKISDILGKCDVSIASVYQKEPIEKKHRGVPIVMLTHKVAEKKLLKALKKINTLDINLRKPVHIKILE
jgi:homoserine dehydrogenase